MIGIFYLANVLGQKIVQFLFPCYFNLFKFRPYLQPLVHYIVRQPHICFAVTIADFNTTDTDCQLLCFTMLCLCLLSTLIEVINHIQRSRYHHIYIKYFTHFISHVLIRVNDCQCWCEKTLKWNF